jgi:MFS family permease
MKNFTRFLQDFQHVKLDYILMLLMSFFMRTGQFMLLPFLAIYLAKFSNASPIIIGITVGIGPFVYGIANVFAGFYVDRFGSKKIMSCSLFIGGISLFAFFYQQTITWCFLMNALTGVTRAFFDIGSKSYGIGELTTEQRKISFSLRFMAINSAAAIGPLLGAYFAAINSVISFKIVGLFYIFLSILSSFILKKTNTITKNKPAPLSSFIKIIKDDVSLQRLIMISIIIMLVFSQIDSTLPQYLNANLTHGVKIYSLLLIINAIICVTMQLIVSRLTSFFNEFGVICIGIAFYSLSYIMFALFLNDIALIIAIVMLTFAEITLLPLNDVLLARIAPPNKIGTYYGIAGISMLGFGIGPMLGGVIYEYQSAKALFLVCGIVSLFTLLLYKKLIGSTREQK